MTKSSSSSPNVGFETYKKIDLYVLGDYACSTNASPTFKVAIERFCKKFDEPQCNVMAYFA